MTKYLEERVKDLEEKVERLQQQMNEVYKPRLKGPLDTPNNVWPQHIQPDLGKQIGDNQQPCYWDSIPEKDRFKSIGLSCSCPKCSPWCNTHFGWTEPPTLTQKKVDEWRKSQDE